VSSLYLLDYCCSLLAYLLLNVFSSLVFESHVDLSRESFELAEKFFKGSECEVCGLLQASFQKPMGLRGPS
jgi:hypothetical protein